MTRDEVELRLKQIGFDIRRDDPQSPYATIWLNDEMVGELNTARMEMSKYIPSVIGKTTIFVDRRYFVYNKIDNVNVLKDLKRDLLDSANRWDESLRQYRVKKVKEYFKEKREAPMLEDLSMKVLYPGRVFPVMR